jgi:hypothetical protein
MHVETTSDEMLEHLEQKSYMPIKVQNSDSNNSINGIIIEYNEQLPKELQPQLAVVKKMLEGVYLSALEELVELKTRDRKISGGNSVWSSASAVHHISRLIEHRDVAMSGHSVGNLLDDISVHCGRALAIGAR